MLGKLMKYEFKATSRVFLPLFAALIIIAAVNRVIYLLGLSVIPQVIGGMLFAMILIGMFSIVIIQAVSRFWNNLLSGEGHLMLTLPVSVNSHILSKMFVVSIWAISSFAAAIISFAILAPYEFNGGGIFSSIVSEIGGLFAASPGQMTILAIEFFLFVILAVFASILTLYACMSLSQLVNNHRVLFTFGIFVAINTVLQIAVALFLALCSLLEMEFRFLTGIFIKLNGAEQATFVMFVMILFEMLLCTAFYFITRYMLKNKLNLQ